MDILSTDSLEFHPNELYAIVKGFSRDKPSVIIDDLVVINVDQIQYIIDNGVFGVNAEFVPKSTLSNVKIKKRFPNFNSMLD